MVALPLLRQCGPKPHGSVGTAAPAGAPRPLRCAGGLAGPSWGVTAVLRVCLRLSQVSSHGHSKGSPFQRGLGREGCRSQPAASCRPGLVEGAAFTCAAKAGGGERAGCSVRAQAHVATRRTPAAAKSVVECTLFPGHVWQRAQLFLLGSDMPPKPPAAQEVKRKQKAFLVWDFLSLFCSLLPAGLCCCVTVPEGPVPCPVRTTQVVRTRGALPGSGFGPSPA